MYNVSRNSHERYGSVILIERADPGVCLTPFQAVQSATKERRLWREAGPKKVRILVDSQVMSVKQAEHWAHEEYKSLPKCEGCAKILNGELHTHQLAKSHTFCSQECADRDYAEQLEILKDEEEIDYL